MQRAGWPRAVRISGGGDPVVIGMRAVTATRYVTAFREIGRAHV